MQEPTKTISLAGSDIVTWDLIDQRAKQLGFDRSSYTQQLYEKDITKKRFDRIRSVIDLLIMLIGFSIIILILLVVR